MMGDGLKKLRDRFGLTQTELASRAGVSHSIIQKMEASGKSLQGTPRTHRKVAEAMGMDLEGFVLAVQEASDGATESPVRMLTADGALKTLRWFAGLRDEDRRLVVGKLSELDARTVLCSMADRIRPVPVRVIEPGRPSAKDGKGAGTHAHAQ